MRQAKEDWRDQKRTQAVTGFIRRHWETFGFLTCFGILTILILYTLNLATKDDLAEQNREAIKVAWETQLKACQDSNENLRREINHSIVEPLHTVVSIAATPSGDPAFDIFVPQYQRALDQIDTIRVQLCHNRYPAPGVPSQGPLYREVPLESDR